ncbi:MAG: succinate dehydrogenase assembly factor 2 [Rhodobacteraceae bacterium]|nr:MAG: succinate dehydrogenase assembly factor 2 [Paracoccaceae bacterium]
MTETRDSRLKKLRIRSWRRGTKEMDLLLGPYADEALAALDGAALDAYERLLEENDQDLYAWISGQAPAAPRVAEALGRVAAFHGVA